MTILLLLQQVGERAIIRKSDGRHPHYLFDSYGPDG